MSVQGEGGVAVAAGGAELAQTRGVPAHQVERVGVPYRLVEAAVEVEGVSGVLQGPQVVPRRAQAIMRSWWVWACPVGSWWPAAKSRPDPDVR